MIFEALNEAADKGELILIGCGMCRFHRRRDWTVTIREIIVLPHRRKWGLGRWLVQMASSGARGCRARCPADLESNKFWAALGFTLEKQEAVKKSGRLINVWWKECEPLPSAWSGAKGATPRAHALPSAPVGGTASAPTTTTTPPS